MLARFFIDRPIFAVVASVVITLAGTSALVSSPVAQYPQITPPGESAGGNGTGGMGHRLFCFAEQTLLH